MRLAKRRMGRAYSSSMLLFPLSFFCFFHLSFYYGDVKGGELQTVGTPRQRRGGAAAEEVEGRHGQRQQLFFCFLF